MVGCVRGSGKTKTTDLVSMRTILLVVQDLFFCFLEFPDCVGIVVHE